MRIAWVKLGGVVGAVLVPWCGASALAVAQTTDGRAGMTTLAAEELTQRSKPARFIHSQPTRGSPARPGGRSARTTAAQPLSGDGE